MQVLSVQSRKGGTGKTTMAIHWGIEAWEEEKNVVWAELDDQGSMTAWFKTRASLHPDEDELLCATFKGVDRLAQFVEHCRDRGDIDLLVIDTRPNVLGFTRAAVEVSDLVAIVTKPSAFDISAVQETLSLAQEIGTPAGVVVTCAQSAALAREARHVLQRMGADVCPKHIMARVEFIRACAAGLAVGEVNETSKGAQEVRATWTWLKSILPAT